MAGSPDEGAPEKPTFKVSGDWRRDASHVPLALKNFAPLSIDEKITYWRWRRVVLLFYSGVALALTAVAVGHLSPVTRDENPALEVARNVR